MRIVVLISGNGSNLQAIDFGGRSVEYSPPSRNTNVHHIASLRRGVHMAKPAM